VTTIDAGSVTPVGDKALTARCEASCAAHMVCEAGKGFAQAVRHTGQQSRPAHAAAELPCASSHPVAACNSGASEQNGAAAQAAVLATETAAARTSAADGIGARDVPEAEAAHVLSQKLIRAANADSWSTDLMPLKVPPVQLVFSTGQVATDEEHASAVQQRNSAHRLVQASSPLVAEDSPVEWHANAPVRSPSRQASPHSDHGLERTPVQTPAGQPSPSNRRLQPQSSLFGMFMSMIGTPTKVAEEAAQANASAGLGGQSAARSNDADVPAASVSVVEQSSPTAAASPPCQPQIVPSATLEDAQLCPQSPVDGTADDVPAQLERSRLTETAAAPTAHRVSSRNSAPDAPADKLHRYITICCSPGMGPWPPSYQTDV
jgi:hypothetical protein